MKSAQVQAGDVIVESRLAGLTAVEVSILRGKKAADWRRSNSNKKSKAKRR